MDSSNQQVLISEHGGPEVLQLRSGAVPEPGPGDVLVRNTAIGVNFIDVYYRTGLYPADLPLIPGLEGAGVVERVGEGVVGLNVGDRVAYCGPMGAYQHYLLRPVSKLVRIPEGVSDTEAASALLKGMTAHYLLHSTYPLKSGETVLVHAAAGGVGQLLCQWAKRLGARVIGCVGSESKKQKALAAGCDQVFVREPSGIASEVREFNAGRGVDVVYDGVGKDTFLDSLDCLRPRGTMVSFGNASGAVPAFALSELAGRGSLFVTRPNLADYMAEPAEYALRANAVLHALQSGDLSLEGGRSYPLSEVQSAHADLEARLTTGSSVLIP